MPTGRLDNGRYKVWTAFLALLLSSTALQAAPPIRMSDKNPMPVCVSPERLMQFLRDRNDDLDPRYQDIAQWYKHWGDQWKVRWDYAFFQMVIETNYLKFRRGNGRRGDVHEKQNNFAGIGATGGGVPGNKFPDVKTGVHAQIQHLVAYSGEFIDDPVAPRTELTQDGIIAQSKRLGRPVTFGDLSRRWAADRKYGRTIDTVAGYFFDGYCKGPAPLETASVAKDTKFVRVADAGSKPAGLGGPKPNKLAGPETMPWDEGINAAQAAAVDIEPPAAKQPAKQKTPEKKSGPPVRTIWTREKGAIAKPQAPGAAAPKAEPAEPIPVTIETPAEQQPPAEAQAAVSAEPTPDLPTFKIAPEKIAPDLPEPSKLGGPVDEDAAPQPKPAPRPAMRQAAIVPPAAVEAADRAAEGKCRVLTASYGGKKTLLVRSSKNGETQLTALSVVDGFEKSMLATYAKANAPDAKLVSEHASKAEAVAAANEICGNR